MKKKINLESLVNKDIFGSFSQNKIKNISTTNLKGGTSTSLCKTETDDLDSDAEHAQENLKDQRCSGY